MSDHVDWMVGAMVGAFAAAFVAFAFALPAEHNEQTRPLCIALASETDTLAVLREHERCRDYLLGEPSE